MIPPKIPNKVRIFTIDETHMGQRIDNFLFNKLKGLPKSRIYRAIRSGEIRVNKKRIKPDYRLGHGDQIRIPPFKLPDSPPKNLTLSRKNSQLIEKSIIYEDNDLIILNKPAGIAVHGGSGIQLGIIEMLRLHRPMAKLLELVHRLDRETSGCLLIAKKSGILKELHSLLAKRDVNKLYLMLVYGQCNFNEKIVDRPLYKYQLRSGERVVKIHEEGKSAITHFQVLKRFHNSTLLQAKPITGRTHQLRVHAASIGYPIVGDEKYGTRKLSSEIDKLIPKRLYLHAAEISFKLATKPPIAICSVLDSDWIDALNKLSRVYMHQS